MGLRLSSDQLRERWLGKAPLHKEAFWTTPAAWRARLRDGRVAVWQVFAYNEPICAFMRKHA